MHTVTHQQQSLHSSINRPQKSKQQYSRNVKKLKYKLSLIQSQIQSLQLRIKTYQNTSNDQIISYKIVKFCKQRSNSILFIKLFILIGFTPEMLFRFADKYGKNTVTRIGFKNMLNQIGLKLNQNQLTRLEYLLDQDISGEISWNQYNNYLYAFGMKKQYNPDDDFLKNALKKLDINKIFQINNKDKQNRKNLLNYQQFLKYCHKHFKNLSDKQLASIFDKLKRNQLIDLNDLFEYIKNLQEQRKRKLQKQQQRKKRKSTVKIKEKQKKKILDLTDQIPQQQPIDISTIQGKLLTIIKNHPLHQLTFHSSQFIRLQKMFPQQIKRGQCSSLFKAIDIKWQGVIDYNNIILFYLNEFKNDKIKLLFVFRLMGQKLMANKQKPKQMIQQYIVSEQKDYIKSQQFNKLCKQQFQLINIQSTDTLYQILLQNNPSDTINKQYSHIQTLINLLKVSNRFKPIIKPSLWFTFKKDFYRYGCQTIVTDAFVALRLCISIIEQINQLKQLKNNKIKDIKKWDDYQFGSNFDDQYGLDSIQIPLPNIEINWIRTDKINMKDFYIPQNNNNKIKNQSIKKNYTLTPLCHNQSFYQALQLLIKQNSNFLTPKVDLLNIKKHKKVQQNELKKLFIGLHPLIFHQFQSYGIYVIRFYTQNKWIYVITDDKIPCDKNNQPLFGKTTGQNCNYVSIVEKAYAKLKGSYQKAYRQGINIGHYLNQLSSFLPYQIQYKDYENKNQENTKQWKIITKMFNKQYMNVKQNNYIHAYLMNNYNKTKNITNNSIPQGTPINISATLQLLDQKCSNSHKSHRLLFCSSLYPLNNLKQLNPEWCTNEQKHKKHSKQLQTFINSNKLSQFLSQSLQNKTKNFIINYKLTRTLFNRLLCIKNVSFDDMIILRKQIQFEKDHKCVYKLKSTMKNKQANMLIVILNKIRSSNNPTIKLTMKNTQKQQKQPIICYQLQEQFGCFCFQIPSQDQHSLQIFIQSFKQQSSYIYSLSFYFLNPKYQMKQRDRQILFRYVSEYEEHPEFDIDRLEHKLRQYIYEKYFTTAGRKGILCC